MADTTLATAAATRPIYGSMSRDRRWALRWSYFFLILFAIFFLTPPIYMLITSLKTSAEISAATNPWWVFKPTLENYTGLLTSNQFLRFFWNSAIVSIFVVTLTMLISIPAGAIADMYDRRVVGLVALGLTLGGSIALNPRLLVERVEAVDCIRARNGLSRHASRRTRPSLRAAETVASTLLNEMAS